MLARARRSASLLAVALHFSGALRRGALPAARRLAGRADRDHRAAARRLVRLRDRCPKLAIIALVCFFPVVVTTLDALRLRRPRPAQAPAHARRLALAGLPLRRGARRPARRAERREDRRRRRGHRRRLRRVRRLQRRASATSCSRRSRSSRPPRAYAAVVLLAAFAVAPLLRPRPGRAPARAVGQPPTGRTPHVTPIRRLTCALLALACAVARRLRRAAASPTRRRRQQRVVRVDARLLPQRRPRRRSTPRRRTGAFRRAGLDVAIQTPSDPSAPLKLLAAGKVDLAISYEPELLLARDKGQQLVAVGALVQKPLTSVMSIGKQAITTPSELAGKTVGTAGIPYQSAYLKAILGQAGVDPVVGQGGQRRLQPRPGDAVQARSTRRSARSGTTRASSSPSSASTRRSSAWRTPACPTYNELVIVARQDDARRRRAARRSAASCGRSRRARRRSSRTRPPASTRCCKANPDLDRAPAARPASRRRCRSSSPPTRPSRSAAWTRRVGAPTATGWRTTGCSQTPPTPARALTERVPAGRRG